MEKTYHKGKHLWIRRSNRFRLGIKLAVGSPDIEGFVWFGLFLGYYYATINYGKLKEQM